MYCTSPRLGISCLPDRNPWRYRQTWLGNPSFGGGGGDGVGMSEVIEVIRGVRTGAGVDGSDTDKPNSSLRLFCAAVTMGRLGSTAGGASGAGRFRDTTIAGDVFEFLYLATTLSVPSRLSLNLV